MIRALVLVSHRLSPTPEHETGVMMILAQAKAARRFSGPKARDITAQAEGLGPGWPRIQGLKARHIATAIPSISPATPC